MLRINYEFFFCNAQIVSTKVSVKNSAAWRYTSTPPQIVASARSANGSSTNRRRRRTSIYVVGSESRGSRRERVERLERKETGGQFRAAVFTEFSDGWFVTEIRSVDDATGIATNSVRADAGSLCHFWGRDRPGPPAFEREDCEATGL